MSGVVTYGPGDVRVEEREDPLILEPIDGHRAMDERRATEVLLTLGTATP